MGKFSCLHSRLKTWRRRRRLKRLGRRVMDDKVTATEARESLTLWKHDSKPTWKLNKRKALPIPTTSLAMLHNNVNPPQWYCNTEWHKSNCPIQHRVCINCRISFYFQPYLSIARYVINLIDRMQHRVFRKLPNQLPFLVDCSMLGSLRFNGLSFYFPLCNHSSCW